jgi:hypothetical protein
MVAITGDEKAPSARSVEHRKVMEKEVPGTGDVLRTHPQKGE